MPRQETFLVEKADGVEIEVLKTYDRSYAQEVFRGMSAEAMKALAATLSLTEKYEASEIPDADAADYEDFLWEEICEDAIEDVRQSPTLATQSINRGMSLEAIAALLGHRSMDMTLTYARISDETVANAYFKVTEAVEAQYYGLSGSAPPRAARSSAPPVSDHRRLLANGHCTRPALLDCAFESVCERCGFFETGPQFVTILKRQRKHADDRGQSGRSRLFDDLIEGVADAQ